MTDWPGFDPGFSTPEMTEVFSPAGRVEALLDFEAALALALAHAGVAPAAQAEAVAAACREPVEDPEEVLAATWEDGTPMIGLLERIGERLTDEERRWLHHGATTQDAVDTASILVARRGIEIIEDRLTTIGRSLTRLAEAHRDQPQMGRTFLQHARPTTFGFRAAMWLDAALRHLEELRSARSGLVVQLGGPVGTRAELGGAGSAVVEALAHRLGLGVPEISWHTDRSRLWSLVSAIEHTTRTLAKVASDLVLLAQSDVGEISVRAGGSSSMSGKRNPIDPIRALAAADVCGAASALIGRGRPHELDRAVSAWHVEWFALPVVFQSAAAVCEATARALDSLSVRGEVMGSRVADEVDLGEGVGEQIDRVIERSHQILGGA